MNMKMYISSIKDNYTNSAVRAWNSCGANSVSEFEEKFHCKFGQDGSDSKYLWNCLIFPDQESYMAFMMEWG
ncbi:Uncharacterised protein [uncultured archaeon]|nr:Uncharacterised protein [uncultured archaeon]